MKTTYRYRKERYFARPPDAIWPLVADTARINEMVGSPLYQVEERADARGRIRRFASAGVGPIRLRWEEGFGEWQENRQLMQVRHFMNGPIRRFLAGAELYPEGTGSRLVFLPKSNARAFWGGWRRHLVSLNGKATSASL